MLEVAFCLFIAGVVVLSLNEIKRVILLVSVATLCVVCWFLRVLAITAAKPNKWAFYQYENAYRINKPMYIVLVNITGVLLDVILLIRRPFLYLLGRLTPRLG